MKKSAGLVIIYDNKILLAHPTNNKWLNSYSIPKGAIDFNEEIIDAAIRETKEEVGLIISKNIIEPTQYCIDYINDKNKLYKKVYYYIVRLNNIDNLILPKQQLQIEEVDWAGFLSKEEAEKRIHHRLINILKHLQ